MFLNNRHHDPTLGAFISVDPLVTITGEPYIYGSANPITYSDPDGLLPAPPIGAPGWVVVDDAPKPQDPDFGEPLPSTFFEDRQHPRLPSEELQLSPRGLDMLASWEGIGPNGFNRAYDDPTGNCTIGIGHLVHLGPCTPAELARVYSSDELVSLHERDVEDHSRQIGDFIGFDLLQAEYDALVIFSFQQGSGGLGEPKNQGILEAIAVGPEVWDLDQIYLVWSSRYTSTAPPGIIRRRAAEALLFTTGTYTIN